MLVDRLSWVAVVVALISASASGGEISWDCSSKVENFDINYYKEYYCYSTNLGTPPIPSIEGQDPLLLDSPTYRQDKVQDCAKAALGRGFRYFALFNNGHCLSSWDASTTYSVYGYRRTVDSYCYYYCYGWFSCSRKCYEYLIYCGTGYGDSSEMNVYSNYYAYDVMLWISFSRTTFTHYGHLFDKGSASTNVDYALQSWIKGEIEGKKICGINNGTLQLLRPNGSESVVAHYLFPTAFQNISYIAEQMIGLTYPAMQAKVTAVHQYTGRCYDNPYARATAYLSSDFFNPDVYLKQNSYYIRGYSYFYCNIPAQPSYKWEAVPLGPDNNTIGEYSTLSTSVSWTLPARTLPYGLYFVQFTTSSSENQYTVGHDYGFIKITPGPLYVYISRGSSAVYIEKSNISMDALSSYDPDFFSTKGNYTGMSFYWVCYRSGESPDLNNASYLPVVYPDGTVDEPSEESESGGCFNTGPGLLPMSEPAITFNSSLLLIGNTYYMTLVVQKGPRIGIYTQVVTMAEGPPKFNISCFSNCFPNAVLSIRLGLRVHCLGPKCERTLYYNWFMYNTVFDEVTNATVWNETVGFYDNLLTSYSSTEILLQENFLKMKTEYRIVFQVLTTENADREVWYEFRTNIPPQGGTCTMDKSVGQAALEEFMLTCIDWVDVDLPLTYQVNVPKADGTYVVMAVGPNSSIPLRLPVGDKNDKYRLLLEAHIIDSWKGSTAVNLSVIAYPPDLSDMETELTALVVGDGALDTLVKDGSDQQAVQLSISVLSVVESDKNSNSTTSNVNSTLIRDNIVKTVTQIVINGTDGVNQIASVLVEATKEEKDLSPETGLQSLGACKNMSAILSEETNNTGNSEAVTNAGKQIVMVTGNVLGGAVLSERHGNVTKLEEMAKKCLEMTETVAKVFLARLLPGEKPALFQGKHLTMELFRERLDALPRSMDIEGGSFAVPSDLPFFKNHSLSFVDRNVKFTHFDPFIWGRNQTFKAATPVLSLSFSDEHGQPIPVQDSSSDIDIIIPTTGTGDAAPESSPVNFLNPGTDTVAYHSFEIIHNNTAFSVRLEPEDEIIYVAYLNYGTRPNETHYDFEILIPDFSSCVLPQDLNCTMVSNFMQCLSVTNVTYLEPNFTKPGVPKSCGPPQNESVPKPAPAEDGQEDKDVFKCPDICKYDNTTFNNCSCDEIPDVSFLFNLSMAEDSLTCKNFIDFSVCPSDTLPTVSKGQENCTNTSCDAKPSLLCKNTVNLLSCYALTLERFEKCHDILTTPHKLFYGKYEKCLRDPFNFFFDHTVGKAGKMYVAVQVYKPPFVNSTEEEEDPSGDEGDGSDQGWREAVKNMTDEDMVKSFLEEYTVAEVSKHTNRTVTLKDKRCRMWRASCKKWVKWRLNYWKGWLKKQTRDDYNDDDDDGGDEDDDDRERRSLGSLADMDQTGNEEQASRLCVLVKEKPPPPKIGEEMALIEEPEFDLNTSSLYSFDVRLYTCLFWDDVVNEWSTKGCKAGPNSTQDQLHCLCNHLTSFGGDLLVTPNTVNFDEVVLGFSNLGVTGNVGVIVAVGLFFLIYVVGVVFARRADRRDKEQLSISIPIRTRKSGDQTYEITVYTGMFGSSGTTANVSMLINGEKGDSEVLPLMDMTGNKNHFSRGSVSSFVAMLPNSLGKLNYIRIWHDNSGDNPSWNLRQIVVRHVASDRKWFFICNRWLAVGKDDGQIERTFFVADRKEMSGFQNLFYTRASNDIGDGHLWFSVYTRPPNSSFTRVQRLTCCISLLFSSMVANAMFYELGAAQESLHIKFGPFDFTWREMMIGIQSSVLVVPVNLLIITMFRYSGPKTNTTKQTEASPVPKKKNKTKLPHWFIYIAYTLALLTSLTGAAFTVFYSMIWGKEKSNKWIISVIVSLVQDIFFLQPLKVLLLASLLTILFRKPPEEERNELQSDEIFNANTSTVEDADFVEEKMQNPKTLSGLYCPPDPMIVALAREKKLNETKMWKMIGYLAIQVFFVFLLSVTSYGSRSSDRFWMTKNVKDILNVKIDKVRDIHTFWWWCENYMLPGIYTTTWYNGKKFNEENFFSNKKSFIVGLPRLRQARVKPGPCEPWSAYPELERWFPRCYHEYSSDNADDTPAGSTLEMIDVSPSYIRPSSSSNNDSSSSSSNEKEPTLSRVCEHTLDFQDASSLGTLPLVTPRNTYQGGGLVAELGYDLKTAQKVIYNLQEDFWITRRTRAFILEFVLFEPGTNMFAFTRYTFESIPSGGIVLTYRIDPISFNGTGNSVHSSIFVVCYVLIVLIIVFTIFAEIKKMYQQKCAYFKDVWNIVELCFVCCTIATIVVFLFKSEYTRQLIEKVHQNPYARMSFDLVALWTDIESVLLATVIFLATLKFLRILKFNKHIAIMVKSMKISKGPMVSYSIVFTVMLMGFASFGNLAFGSSNYMFSSFTKSLVNSFEMILGKGTNYYELETVDRFYGPLFIFAYFFSMTVLLMNFFVAILNDSFTEAREILEKESSEDSELAEFISDYLKEFLREISQDLRSVDRKSYTPGDKYGKYSAEIKERDFFLY